MRLPGIKKEYNSSVYNGSLFVGHKNKKLLKHIKFIAGCLDVHVKIDELPDDLEVASNLNFKTTCPNLNLKNLKVYGYIKFVANGINKIYPSVQAEEYYVENIWYDTIFTFNNVYDIYEAFPHLVPDEFQNEYGFEHIQVKAGQEFVPVVLGNINPKDIPIITRAKYVVVYSAEKQILDVMRGDDYCDKLYSEIFNALPDFED